MVERVTTTAAHVNWDTAVAVLPNCSTTPYTLGGHGGEKQLPRKDRHGKYHVDGNLMVADKLAVKDLASTLALLLKALGGRNKLVLTLLARYWVAPCCSETDHLTNYHSPGYLQCLGEAVASLCDHIRNAFFTRRIPSFRVLCPNRMFGMGLRRQDISDKEATWTAALWGLDPVHLTAVAYGMMAEAIEADLRNLGACYTNPPKQLQLGAKKARHDPSLERAGWVDGCSAALPRKDSLPAPGSRGHSFGASPARPGPSLRCNNLGRGSARGFHRGYPRSGSRGFPFRGRGGSY
jgi:hypothetical protein